MYRFDVVDTQERRLGGRVIGTYTYVLDRWTGDMYHCESDREYLAETWVHPNKGTKHDIGFLAVHDSHPMLLEKGVREQGGVQNPVFLVFGACARPCPQCNLSGQSC